jgi:hypothetical protein
MGGIEYSALTEAEGKELRRRLGTKLLDAQLERMIGGPIARAILCDGEVVYRRGRGDSDFDCLVDEIQKGIRGSSSKDAWAVIYEHEPVVQADLKRMWPVVEALAQELVNKKELSEYEIRSIVRIAVNKLPEDERTWAISRLRNTPSRG